MTKGGVRVNEITITITNSSQVKSSKDVFLQVASAVEFMVVPLGNAKKALFRLTYADFLLAYWR
jgi:hypothetical protein